MLAAAHGRDNRSSSPCASFLPMAPGHSILAQSVAEQCCRRRANLVVRDSNGFKALLVSTL